MAFSRDEIAAYEKQTPTEVPDTLATAFSPPAATAPEGTPAAEAPAADAAPPAADETDPAAPGGESSADTTADSATASADDSASETQTDGTDEGDASNVRRGTAADRIQGLNAENKALRKYIEYREQLWRNPPGAEGTSPSAAAAKPETPAAPAAPAPANDPRPTLEQFDYDLAKHQQAEEEWLQRQIDRRVEAGLGKVKEEQTKQTAEQEAAKVREAFEERAAKFSATHPDFKTVMQNPNVPSLNPDALKYVVRSDQSAEILYHFGKHPDVAARIARLPRDQQIAAVGRLEGQLSTPTPTPTPTKTPAKQKTTTSQAPSPPNVTAGGTPAERSPTDPSLTMEEFVALERKKELAARQARQARRQAMR